MGIRQNQTDLETNVAINAANGVAQSLAVSMFGPFLGIFAIRLGASNTMVALLSSVPAMVAALTALPGTLMAQRLGKGKGTVAALYAASRAFYLLVALVPLFAGPARPLALVLLIGLMNLPGTIASISWQSLMADLIPQAERGRAFGLRSRVMTLAGLGPTLAVGWLLDRMPFPLGYQIVFAGAFAVSLVEILLLLRLRDSSVRSLASAPRWAAVNGRRPGVAWTRLGIRDAFRKALLPSPFRSFALRSLAFQFTWQMGWPLFTIFQVRYLGADNTWTGLFSVAGSLTSFLSYQWWGRLGDRVGTARGLMLATVGMALTPALYAVATSLWQLVVLNLSIGFFSAGTLLLLFNGLLEVSPEEDRASYLAVSATLVSVGAAIAPLLGKSLGDVLGVRWALAAVALLRLAACGLFGGLARQEKGGEGSGQG